MCLCLCLAHTVSSGLRECLWALSVYESSKKCQRQHRRRTGLTLCPSGSWTPQETGVFRRHLVPVSTSDVWRKTNTWVGRQGISICWPPWRQTGPLVLITLQNWHLQKEEEKQKQKKKKKPHHSHYEVKNSLSWFLEVMNTHSAKTRLGCQFAI